MINLQSIYDNISAKITIYKLIAQRTHKVEAEEAEKIVLGELETYMTRLHKYITDPKNSGATLTDIQGQNIFLEVLESGLSFSPIANHVYVSRMKGSGTAISYKVTADGEVYQCQRAGAIDHLSEPVLVQDGEQFSIRSTPDGHQIADHVIHFFGRPKFSIDNLQVGYVYVVYPNGDRELSWISAERMRQLKEKSQKPENYSDESFVQTKIIKHALRKVRKTPFVNQQEIDDETETYSSWKSTPATIPLTNEQAGKNLVNSFSQQQPPAAPPSFAPPVQQQTFGYQQPQQQPQPFGDPF